MSFILPVTLNILVLCYDVKMCYSKYFLKVPNFISVNTYLKYFKIFALAGVAQWIEHWAANQGSTGSIPSRGTCLGCRPDPQLGACERQPHIDVSLPLFLSPFPSA